MSKNLIPEIAKLLGVEVGEEFKVKGDDELTYTLTDDGLKITFAGGIEISQVSTNSAFVALVMGKDEIVELPWKPKKGEGYWTFNVFFGSGKWAVASFAWGDEVFDKAVLKAGWVYRTREEAEAALPAVATEMGVDYELQEALNELW